MKLISILSVVILLIQTRFLDTTGKHCDCYCEHREEVDPPDQQFVSCSRTDGSQNYNHSECVSDCKKCVGYLGIKCDTEGAYDAEFVCPHNYVHSIGCDEAVEGGETFEENLDGGLGPGIIAVIVFLVILGTCALVGCAVAFMHYRNSRQ